jgi:ABC-type branched-subunit amino acid transport system substrate-binding protein
MATGLQRCHRRDSSRKAARAGGARHFGRNRCCQSLKPWLWPRRVVAAASSAFAAEKKYDPGATDTEIKLGQTVPHSGPGSLYGVLGRVGEAYFQMLNDNGGINGRKIKFFTMDDR